MKLLVAGLLGLFLFSSTTGSAQNSPFPFSQYSSPFNKKPKDKDGNPDNNNGGGNNPTPVPFDGGVMLLLAAGAAYGVRRYRSRK